MTPVFIISLPRSGSTLLQKTLAVSPQIATTAEAWICLPLAKMTDAQAVSAEYWHVTCSRAIRDLEMELPGGEAECRGLIAAFIRSIYQRIADKSKAKIFLDKTPRYYMIIPFLAQAFPDAKFIFLIRNPLAVLFSILWTWNRNRFSLNLIGNYVDLMRGPHQMAEGLRLLGRRAFSLHYTRLVTEPEVLVPTLCSYLGISFSDGMLTAYKEQQFSGRMGDPVGVKVYKSISRNSIDKWKYGMSNIYRKWYSKRYLNFLGDDTLEALGYSMSELIAEIETVPTTYRGALYDMIGYGMMSAWRLLNHFFVYRGKNVGKNRQRPYLPYG